LYSSPAHLIDLLPTTDLLIGAVLVPGARAPKLITREMLRMMKPGSVLVDIAIDQGGCVETSRPTTHEAPTFFEEGVLHYCVANMPGTYARTSTQALTNVNYPYLESIANLGLAKACEKQHGLLSGINVMGGKLTCQAVAEAHQMSFESVRF
jgi:alanine dehydrogenase